MLNLHVLTGTIGSGKSTASKIFQQYGCVVVDADRLSRQAVKRGSPALSKISKIFGKKVIRKNGSLDRKALGSIIFNDAKKRTLLEEIVHPPIRELLIKKITATEKINKKKTKIFLYVVPLYFEKLKTKQINAEYSFDKIILVTAKREICIKRIIKRDKVTQAAALKKLNSQMDSKLKEKKSDIIIRNNGSVKSLEMQVKKVFRQLRGES